MLRFLEATHEMFEGGEDVPVYRPEPRPESAPATGIVTVQQSSTVAGDLNRASSTPPCRSLGVALPGRETSPEIICLGTQRAPATTGPVLLAAPPGLEMSDEPLNLSRPAPLAPPPDFEVSGQNDPVDLSRDLFLSPSPKSEESTSDRPSAPAPPDVPSTEQEPSQDIICLGEFSGAPQRRESPSQDIVFLGEVKPASRAASGQSGDRLESDASVSTPTPPPVLREMSPVGVQGPPDQSITPPPVLEAVSQSTESGTNETQPPPTPSSPEASAESKDTTPWYGGAQRPLPRPAFGSLFSQSREPLFVLDVDRRRQDYPFRLRHYDSSNWEYHLRDADTVRFYLGDADLVRFHVVDADVRARPMSPTLILNPLSVRLHYIIFMGEGTVEIFVNSEDELDCQPHVATYQQPGLEEQQAINAAVSASLADAVRSQTPMPQLSPVGAPRSSAGALLSPQGAAIRSPSIGASQRVGLASFLNAGDYVEPSDVPMDEDDQWEVQMDPNEPSTSRGILRAGQRGGGTKRKATAPPAGKLPKKPRQSARTPRGDHEWQWPTAPDQAGGAAERQESQPSSLTAGITVEGFPLSHFVEERRRYTTFVRRFGVDGDVVQLRLRNLQDVTRPEVIIARIIERLRSQALQNHPDAEWIGLNFMGGDMEKPFDVVMRHPEQNTAEALFNGLAPYFESYGTEILHSELLEFAITTVSPPDGASCDHAEIPDPLPRGVVPIVNPRDCYCLARAVVVSMHYHEMTDEQFTLYTGVGSGRQQRDALELMRNARLPLNRESYGLTALKRMQRYLDETQPQRWRLALFRSTCRDACLEWAGPQRAEFVAAVYHYKGHFHALVRPGNLFGSGGRFCVDCNKAIQRSGDHRDGCPNTCSGCQREGLQFPCTTAAGQNRVECADCGISFANRNCYEFHRLNFNPQTGNARKPICERRKMCNECGKIYTTGKKNDDGTTAPHECKSTNCRRCGVDHEPDQQACFVRSKADDLWHPKKVVRFVFWDAETTSDRVIQVGNVQGQKHVANQIVAHVFCEKCMDSGADFNQPSSCKYCKVRRRYFGPMGDQPPISRFITWLFSKAPNTHTIAIAHNSGKFDSHLAHEEILTRPDLRVTRNVSQGRKIYELEVRREKYEVHFKDSVNFFHCRLADLPKAFGFEDEQKGFFPYALNKTGNERLRLPRLPEPSLYQRDDMDTARQAQFDEWYALHQHDGFYMADELQKYCEQDVVVLRKACCAFRQKFLEICELDPFVIAATSARLALEVFLRKHLGGDDIIAAIPEYGLTPRRNQSAIAVRWLLHYAEEHQLDVRTCRSPEGEYNIPGTNYFVDGYVEREGQQPLVLEFYGCRWHGCPTCYPARDVNLVENKTAEELYQTTMHRVNAIRVLGYEVVEMWECAVKRRMRTDDQFVAEMSDIEDITPLHPREDGLRGGRTEAFVFYRRVQEGEVIHHRDFTSLYPYVMKYCELPVGAVTVLHRDSLRDHQMPWERPDDIPYKGMLKVKVQPPRKCEPKPLLPYRSKDGRLLFCLCAKCGEECNENRCRHSEQERSWVAAYTHAELREALACGYKVAHVYEAWTWNEWRSGANGIFTSYINTFLKIKLETSKLIKRPGETDHEAKLRLIQETRDNEGIELEYDKIQENPVMRAISKLMLNSLWGKFCQRSDFPEVFNFTEPGQLLRHLRNPDYDHLSISCPNEHVCMVPGPDNMYCDTDSLFYVQAPGAPDLPVAEGRLGWMVEEHPGMRIVEFFAAGPKNYGFKMVPDVPNPAPDDYETELKIRGFSLRTKKAAQALRYKRVRRLVLNTYGTPADRELMDAVSDDEPDPDAPPEEMPPLDEPELELDVPYDVILRTKESTVYGRQQIKRYKAGDRKSRKLPGFRSEPSGYISSSDDDMN